MTTTVASPARLVDPVALRDALAIGPYRDRRMALRKLVQPVLEQMFTTETATQLFARSPLVGEGEKQIVVRPQVSGLRDQLDLSTLTVLAYSGTGLPRVKGHDIDSGRASLKASIELALLTPDTAAMPSTGSRTGYVFGRHRLLTDTFVNSVTETLLLAIPAITRATTTEPEPAIEETIATMPKVVSVPHAATLRLPTGTTLDHLSRILDHVAVRGEMTYADAAKALASTMQFRDDADRFEAAEELSSMRDRPALEDLYPLAEDHARIVAAALSLATGEITLVDAERAIESGETITVSLPPGIASGTIVTTTTAHKDAHMTSTASLPKVDPTVASMIDAMLSSAKLPPLTSLMASIRERDERLDVQGKRLKAMLEERADLERKLAEASAAPAVALPSTVEASHDGTMPAGEVSWVPAHEAFGLAKGKDAFSFKVPVWKWDGVHPHVPQVDKHYVFRPFELMRVLYGIIANKRVYLHGHTGTGKTTLIEQVAARLGYPFMRLNFDSEISRMDLIGRDTLTSDGGTTVSRFVDGILPQMMQSPCIGCFDEIDFVRPDIAYVMQRMLEGDALVITEDGGRVVKPHPMFRAFATGNTVGQGDEHGMYQGARVQSTALLDRFSVWQRIDYLKPEDRDALIRNKVPALADDLRAKLNSYITEHLQAFTTSKVLQPLSPRGFLGLAEAMVFFTNVIPNRKDAVAQALESTILDRASVQDRVVLKGLADRVFG